MARQGRHVSNPGPLGCGEHAVGGSIRRGPLHQGCRGPWGFLRPRLGARNRLEAIQQRVNDLHPALRLGRLPLLLVHHALLPHTNKIIMNKSRQKAWNCSDKRWALSLSVERDFNWSMGCSIFCDGVWDGAALWCSAHLSAILVWQSR